MTEFNIKMKTLDGLDKAERELTLSKLIVEVHDWLTAAMDDPTVPVSEFANTRAYVTDIVAAVRRFNLGNDVRFDALLVQRLSERAVGKAVRVAQAAGELGSLKTNNPGNRGKKLPSPFPYIGAGTTAHLIYQMTDGVTDAQFNAVLNEARAEGNLTRGYIVRKITEVQTGKKVDARPDLIESVRELAEQLRRITVKLRKLQNDDRLERNKAEVAARMRFYVVDAEIVCTALRKTLDKDPKTEGSRKKES